MKTAICGSLSTQGSFNIVLTVLLKCIIYDYEGRVKNCKLLKEMLTSTIQTDFVGLFLSLTFFQEPYNMVEREWSLGPTRSGFKIFYSIIFYPND